MKKSRYSEEQIIAVLKEHQAGIRAKHTRCEGKVLVDRVAAVQEPPVDPEFNSSRTAYVMLYRKRDFLAIDG